MEFYVFERKYPSRTLVRGSKIADTRPDTCPKETTNPSNYLEYICNYHILKLMISLWFQSDKNMHIPKDKVYGTTLFHT